MSSAICISGSTVRHREAERRPDVALSCVPSLKSSTELCRAEAARRVGSEDGRGAERAAVTGCEFIMISKSVMGVNSL